MKYLVVLSLSVAGTVGPTSASTLTEFKRNAQTWLECECRAEIRPTPELMVDLKAPIQMFKANKDLNLMKEDLYAATGAGRSIKVPADFEPMVNNGLSKFLAGDKLEFDVVWRQEDLIGSLRLFDKGSMVSGTRSAYANDRLIVELMAPAKDGMNQVYLRATCLKKTDKKTEP